MALTTLEKISMELGVSEPTVRKYLNILPVFGFQSTERKSYKSSTKMLSFIQNRIKEEGKKVGIEDLDFKGAVESFGKKILNKEILYKKKGNVKTIAFNNFKGGVAKTTVTANLGAILAYLNQKVLLIDMDMQNQLSDSFQNKSYEEKNIANIIKDTVKTTKANKNKIKEIIDTVDIGNQKTVDILPSYWNLGKELLNSYIIAKEKNTILGLILRKIINAVKDDYDFILIDTSPTNVIALEMSFFASDLIVLVSTAEEKSISSLNYLRKELKLLTEDAKSFNLEIKIDSIIATKFKKQDEQKDNLKILQYIQKKDNIKNLLIFEEKALVEKANATKKALIGYSKDRIETINILNDLIKYAIYLIDNKE